MAHPLVYKAVQQLVHTVGSHCYASNGPRCEKTCLPWFANNEGADQPAHMRSLISAFAIGFLESIICKLATGEISETGLKLNLSETRKTGFLATRPK